MKKLTLCLLSLCILLLLAGTASAELRTFDVTFTDTGPAVPRTYTAQLDDDWFDHSSSQYDHSLAQASMAMTLSAFRDEQSSDLSQTDRQIRSFFEHAGFEGYEAYDYHEKPSSDSISSSIAYRRMEDADGPYVLLATPVCGQGYGNEWLSNFYVSDEDNHAGFDYAAQLVYQRVLTYIDTHHLSGERIKIWGSGFSRAAAVSNMLGHMLLCNSRFEQDNIFIYTFGTPNTTKAPVAWPQIHNICGSFDPVPRIPFADWKFGKHGITHYLPSRETSVNYDELCVSPRAFFRQLVGTDEGFDAIPARNWLIGKLLDMLYSYVPQASMYSDTLQDAVMTAWVTEGTVMDRLLALISVAEAEGAANNDWNQIQTELLSLISTGAADTLLSASGQGGSSLWFDLLSSGTALAGEHYPRIYLSWLMSDLTPEQLFGQGSQYLQFIVYGDTLVQLFEPVGDDELLVLLDTDSTDNMVAWTEVRGSKYIQMPVTSQILAMVYALNDTNVVLAGGGASTARVHNPLNVSNIISLKKDDYLYAIVDSDEHGKLQVEVIADTDQPIDFFSDDQSDRLNEILAQTAKRSTNDLLLVVSGGVVMGFFLVSALMIMIYYLVVGIKRIARGQIDDHARHRTFGKWLSICLCVPCVVIAGVYLYDFIVHLGQASAASVSHSALGIVSKYIGWGTNAYYVSAAVMYLLLALGLWRSITHQLSRIRTARLALLLLLLNAMSFLLSHDIKSSSALDFIQLFLPVFSLVALGLVRVRDAEDEIVGRKWLAILRAVNLTVLLFVVRQGILWFSDDKTQTVTILLKGLTCVPALILALDIWRRTKKPLYRSIFLTILTYTIANVVIDYSYIAGALVYIVGHVILLLGLYAQRKPTKLQWIVWPIVTAIFAVELILLRDRTPQGLLPVAFLYDLIICGMAVLAFPIHRRLRTASIFFILSNHLLLFTFVYPDSFALDSIELLLFYIAVVIFAAGPEAVLSRHKNHSNKRDAAIPEKT